MSPVLAAVMVRVYDEEGGFEVKRLLDVQLYDVISFMDNDMEGKVIVKDITIQDTPTGPETTFTFIPLGV